MQRLIKFSAYIGFVCLTQVALASNSPRTFLTTAGLGIDKNTDPYVTVSYYSTDGGTSWKPSDTTPTHPMGRHRSAPYSIKCDSSGKICNGVGAFDHDFIYRPMPLLFRSTNGGVNWDISNVYYSSKREAYLSAIDCDTTGTRCAAIGNINGNDYQTPISYFTTDGGKNWLPSDTPPPPSNNVNVSPLPMEAISCSSDGLRCMAINNEIRKRPFPSETYPLFYTSSDGGKNWIVSAIPAEKEHPFKASNLTCDATGLKCIVAGRFYNAKTNEIILYAMTSKDAGKNWEVAKSFPISQKDSSPFISSLSCDQSATECLAVGHDAWGKIFGFYSIDGGENWIASSMPEFKDRAYIYSAICDSEAKSCLALGRTEETATGPYHYHLFRTTDAGKTWSASAMKLPAHPQFKMLSTLG